MKNVVRNLTSALAGVVGLVSAGTAVAQTNSLINQGFEELCVAASGWTTFGNTSSINFYTTSGVRSIKSFGTFCGTGPCYSGIYQDIPASAGQQWRGSANLFSPCWDRLRPIATGGTQAFVSIDFLDANDTFLNAAQAFISPIQSESTVVGGNATCNIGEPFPEPVPVNLQTAFATAPAGTAKVRITLFVEQTQFVGGSAWWDDAVLEQSGGGNVLANSSFEDQPANCFGSPYVGWVNFGNGQGNFQQNVRTGDYAAMLFGGFNGNPAFSGWFQNVSTTVGKRWVARGYGRSSSTDSLAIGNDVHVAIEFFDQFGTNLVGQATRSTSVPVPGDDTYRFYTTGVASAPLGATQARCLIIQEQANFAGGATWWDDMELIEVCGADLDDGSGTGNVDFGVDINDLLFLLAKFEAGDVAADLDDGSGTGIPDGGVDINDLLYFLVRFELGC